VAHRRHRARKPGIELTSRLVLRWGVALLGLRITAAPAAALGWHAGAADSR
jgi:uncharacterized membrane protein YadS